MNCCVDNEIYFLFLVLSRHSGYLVLLPETALDGGTVQEFLTYYFQKEVVSLDLLIEETSYSLFTWKINQVERLNNIIQASRAAGEFLLVPLSRVSSPLSLYEKYRG